MTTTTHQRPRTAPRSAAHAREAHGAHRGAEKRCEGCTWERLDYPDGRRRVALLDPCDRCRVMDAWEGR